MEVFLMILFGVIGWMIYMMTCRTDDFIRLVKADDERRKNSGARLGKAVRGGVGIAKFFMKR